MIPRDLILDARKAAQEKNWDKADEFYTQAIISLEKRRRSSLEANEAYLSAKAECLSRWPYIQSKESFHQFRQRIFDAIRYLYECYNLKGKESNNCFNSIRFLIRQYIKIYGCSICETKHHVVMSCPIQLNSDSFGSLGTSIGAFYNKAVCSICGLDLLDEKCIHIRGKIYNNKECIPVIKDYQIAHIALVDRPKDPAARITDVFYPREMFLEKSNIDLSKIDLDQKINIHCTRCRDENIEPELITPELFFKIQGLSIHFNREPKIKSKLKNMKKGEVYFCSTLYQE